MAIVQPGKVPTYTPGPAVSLSEYDDSDRTRLIFNGSQFVKASLVISTPTYVYLGPAPTGTAYTKYKTSSGKYALANGERYVPVATGAPPAGAAEMVVVAYPVTVSTSEVVLWGTEMLSYYDSLYVEYSYDGSFYFTITGSSVSWSFESDEEQYEGESPPSGLYKYSIDLGATYSAKYFRISAYYDPLLSASLSQGSTTINVSSTAGFPDEWLSFDNGLYVGGEIDGGGGAVEWIPITYTGKTSTSFTGVSYESPMSGDYLENSSGKVYFLPSYAENLTEVEPLGSFEALLEFWDTDGTKASSETLAYDKYYDIVYDNNEDAYFTIRLNEGIDGSGGLSFDTSDDFTYSTAVLDSTRWTESTDEPNFQVNTASGTLDYLVSADPGRVYTNYYMAGDFTSAIDIGFNDFTSSDASIELRSIDISTDNEFVLIGIRGRWDDPSPQDAFWVASQIRKTVDTTSGAASVNNFRLAMKNVYSSQLITLVYDSTAGTWSVTSSIDGALLDCTPGVDYSNGPIYSMNVVHSSTPSDGAQIVLNINYQTIAVAGSSPWDWKIGLDRSSNSIVCKYDIGAGLVNWITYTDSTVKDLRFELFADGASGDIDLALDNFSVTGTEAFDNVPVFTIEAVDSSGDTLEILGLTDSDGYLIKSFDVINDVLDYNSFISNRVQLATDNKSEASGGSVYIKVGTDLYKYNKSQFPLTTEKGDNAAVYKASVIPETDAYAFAYNNYSNAGLCYVKYDDVRAGTYLKTISTATISGAGYESFLDVSSADYAWAWDQNNFTVLYYIDSGNLKEYDMDENDVAFTNTSSDEKIMSAGTSNTSVIEATVLNVYGEPLSAKTVSFVVSSGAGAVSPATDCTNASGVATTTYTVGETVGTVSITSTASDATC